MSIIFVSILIFSSYLALANPDDPVYQIIGFAQDFETGLPISAGNVTAIVKETGEMNTSNIANGYFEVNLSSILDYTKNRFTIGLFLNTSNEEAGYSQLKIGRGSYSPQSQVCSEKLWHFSGRVVDSETGQLVDGKVRVSVKGTSEVNSTNFSNGICDIYFSPCLVSGQIYTFEFFILSEDKKSYMFLDQVAK